MLTHRTDGVSHSRPTRVTCCSQAFLRKIQVTHILVGTGVPSRANSSAFITFFSFAAILLQNKTDFRCALRRTYTGIIHYFFWLWLRQAENYSQPPKLFFAYHHTMRTALRIQRNAFVFKAWCFHLAFHFRHCKLPWGLCVLSLLCGTPNFIIDTLLPPLLRMRQLYKNTPFWLNSLLFAAFLCLCWYFGISHNSAAPFQQENGEFSTMPLLLRWAGDAR